ncbi:hypothetical protein IJU97_01110 [bacterium]|nr:hypothetical protein [bacterium]
MLIMGNIPFPVVKYGDYVFPSVYPYVDFIEQKYIWNEDEGYFVINNNEGQAELRHGVISLENA